MLKTEAAEKLKFILDERLLKYTLPTTKATLLAQAFQSAQLVCSWRKYLSQVLGGVIMRLKEADLAAAWASWVALVDETRRKEELSLALKTQAEQLGLPPPPPPLVRVPGSRVFVGPIEVYLVAEVGVADRIFSSAYRANSFLRMLCLLSYPVCWC